jgi:hypothetical protein
MRDLSRTLRMGTFHDARKTNTNHSDFGPDRPVISEMAVVSRG